MSTTTAIKKGESFVKQVVAKLKGDDNEVLAQKIARKAMSAVDGQLAALKSKQVDLENTLEEGAELLAEAQYPTVMITDNQQYIRGISAAQKAYDSAKEELANVTESIKYFEDLLAKF